MGLQAHLELFNAGQGNDTLGLVLFVAYSLAAGSVLFCLAKGKFGLVILAAIPVVGLAACCVGAVRLAKPRSIWARWLYDREAMKQAVDRHEPPIDLQGIKSRKRSGTSVGEPTASSG